MKRRPVRSRLSLVVLVLGIFVAVPFSGSALIPTVPKPSDYRLPYLGDAVSKTVPIHKFVPIYKAPCSSCGGASGPSSMTYWITNVWFRFVWESKSYAVEATATFSHDPARSNGNEVHVFGVNLELTGPNNWLEVNYVRVYGGNNSGSWQANGPFVLKPAYTYKPLDPSVFVDNVSSGLIGTLDLAANNGYDAFQVPYWTFEAPLEPRTVPKYSSKFNCTTGTYPTMRSYPCEYGFETIPA